MHNLTREQIERIDRANAPGFIGKRFADLPIADRVAIWRLTDLKVLKCVNGIVRRWKYNG